MEYEETQPYTPRGSTKLKVPGAKVAANLKRRLSNRLSRTISSERAPGSDASNDNVETPRSKRFSLRHRRSKSRVKKEEEKTMAPRRSFSVDDLSKLVPEDGGREPISPLETEVKVPLMDDSDNLIPEATPSSEGLGPDPPETPVPEQRPIENRDARSSSGISMEIQEMKEMASEDQTIPVETTEETDKVEPVEHIEPVEQEVDRVAEIEPDLTYDLSPDADATIDAGIEETVLASLASQEPPEDVKVETEPKTLDDVHATVTESMDTKEAVEKLTEKVEEPTEVQTQSREADFNELDGPETETAIREVEQPKEPSKEIKDKPKKKRRFARLIKPASFSLATLAVGLLLIILKKH